MVAAICAMHEQWDMPRYGTLADVVDRYARWLPQRAADPRSVFLVADDPAAGTPRGFLIATVIDNIPIYRLREYGFIHDVWVQPDQRSRGVGRALVHEAVRRFTAMGITQIRLETAAPNEAARRLFAACGFRGSVWEMLLETGPRRPDATA